MRELRNAADCFVLGVADMPQETGASGDDADNEQTLKERIEQFERAVIAEANQTGGAVAATADRCMSARRRCTRR